MYIALSTSYFGNFVPVEENRACPSTSKRIPASHLCFLEVKGDLLHERSIVSSLHSEFFVFKVEAAAACLTFSLHCAVWKAENEMSLFNTDCVASLTTLVT